jgi:hypothetical protein
VSSRARARCISARPSRANFRLNTSIRSASAAYSRSKASSDVEIVLRGRARTRHYKLPGNSALVGASRLTNRKDSAPLLTKPGASVVQSYQAFFPLSETRLPPGSSIRLHSADGLFAEGYSETFEIPAGLQLGATTALRDGGRVSMVVQLAYPYDVVFFERSDTPKVTEKLSTRVSALGVAPRVSAGAARMPGSYNVIHSGEDVPVQILQKVLEAVRGDIELRVSNPTFDFRTDCRTRFRSAAT